MSTVITAKPVLDKASYAPGEKVTVTIPGAAATSTTSTTQRLALTLRADDGTETAIASTVPVVITRKLGVKITAISLDGVVGVIAADGLSATVTTA